MSYHENKLAEKKSITQIDCLITSECVKQMIEFYDSGMCDITTQNAAALALKRLLKPRHSVAISRKGRRGPYICKVDGKSIKLSCDLIELFELINHGIAPTGYHFEALVPTDLLLTSPQNEEPVEQTMHSKPLVQSR